jgi:hypothetical protein
MVILHQDPARFRDLPADQMRQVFGKYQAWAHKVRASNS